MFNAQKPDPSELPSTGKLLKSTGIAAAIAGVLLVVAVLPAEYGVDPTGAGKLLGLTEMGRIKMQLAEEAKADAAADAQASAASTSPTPNSAALPTPEPQAQASAPVPAPEPAQQQAGVQSDETTLTLAPDEGGEIKLVMKKGEVAKFEWFTNGPKVNYDTHADAPGINYHGYEKGTGVDRKEGELTAAFDGAHGWFWRNRSGQPVTITLRTSGPYTDLKIYD